VQDADKHDDVAGPGHGIIDVFNTNGVLLQRLVSHDHLNSPWGMAMAPSNFGQFSNDLLVGNFGSGFIDAFNPTTGAFLGQLKDILGHNINIGGLWSLKFGNGHNGQPTNTLFFTAGIGDESHGLFGRLESISNGAVVDPQTVVLTLGQGGMIHIATATPVGQSVGTDASRAQADRGSVDFTHNQIRNQEALPTGKMGQSGSHGTADKVGTDALDRLFAAF
jgi:hypothetical protein